MVVLEILKIIGIVLACIVGLVILVLLVVCFAPVTYAISAKGQNKDIEGAAQIRWLGLVKADASIKGKDFSIKIKAAWKTLFEMSGDVPDADAISDKNDASANTTESTGETPLDNESAGVSSHKLAAQSDNSGGDTNTSATQNTSASDYSACSSSKGENRNYTTDDIVEYLKTDQPKYEEADSDNGEKGIVAEEGPEDDSASDTGSKGKKQKKSFSEKWAAFKEKIISLKNKFFDIKEKLSKAKYIWDAPVTKRALAYIKVLALKLLRHIKPRKIQGYIRFGMDDPGNTALIYGFSAYLAGIMDKHFHVIPEMEEKIIDTDVVIKGRIFIGYMVVLALKFLLNNDITRVRRYIRRNF